MYRTTGTLIYIICNTVVHPVDTRRCDESTEVLRSHVHEQLAPLETTKHGHDERDGGVDVPSCKMRILFTVHPAHARQCKRGLHVQTTDASGHPHPHHDCDSPGPVDGQERPEFAPTEHILRYRPITEDLQRNYGNSSTC